MKKSLLTLLLLITFSLVAKAAPFQKEVCNLGWEHVHHKHNEEAYQHAWCSAHNGITEYVTNNILNIDSKGKCLYSKCKCNS